MSSETQKILTTDGIPLEVSLKRSERKNKIKAFLLVAPLLLFLIISFASIFKATENVTSTKITVLFWVAFWGFLLSILFQEEYEWLHYTSYLFTILIIVGHILNIKHCNECSKQNDNEN